MRWNVTGNMLTIYIEKELYSESVVFKVAYWLQTDLKPSICTEGNYYELSLSLDESEDLTLECKGLTSKVCQQLIDFKNREIIREETFHIKQILFAKAFSHLDEFDSSPPGQLHDGVGFEVDKAFERS